MFYIEKNDKPNLLEKLFKIIVLNDNVLKLPIVEGEDLKEKEIEKLAKRTYKIISSNSNSKKIVLSKNIYGFDKYINVSGEQNIGISDLLDEITKDFKAFEEDEEDNLADETIEEEENIEIEEEEDIFYDNELDDNDEDEDDLKDLVIIDEEENIQ